MSNAMKQHIFTLRKKVGETESNSIQGGSPSPFDRNMGTELAAKATHWIVQKAEANLYNGKVITQVKRNRLEKSRI